MSQTKINLEGRLARCSCGKKVPSSWDLPFFQLARGRETWKEEDAERYDFFCQALRAFSKQFLRSDREFEEKLRKLVEASYQKAEENRDIALSFDQFYCGCRGLD